MTCILGLSGGIGSGKSTVTRILDELGATTIDADAIVHEQQAAGQPMILEIAAAFGDEVIAEDDRSIGRRWAQSSFATKRLVRVSARSFIRPSSPR